MTTQEAIDKIQDVPNMSRDELAKVVQVMSKTANRRLINLRYDTWGKVAPAYNELEQSGVKSFGTRGKTLNQLRHEYLAVRSFLTAKTSSIAGVRKWRLRQEEIWGQRLESPDQLRRLWEAYNRAKETTPIAGYWGNFDSTQIIAAMGEMVRQGRNGDAQKTMEEVIDVVNDLAAEGIRATTDAILAEFDED